MDEPELEQPEEVVITCHYTDPPHEHVYPGDWIFGGADGLHPGADRRWKPNTYTYRDEFMGYVHVTQTPLCDDQAIDEFTKVSGFGPSYRPVYLEVVRPGGLREVLPWVYNGTTDEVRPLGKGVQSGTQESRALDS